MVMLRSLSQGKLEAYKIDPREIEIRPGFNFRDTSTPEAQAHIAWLANSIAERGVDEPIWVENTGEKIFLIAGECRLLALRKLWDEGNEVYVPTFSYKGDEASVLAKSLAENTGLPPSVIEFGRAAERLLAFGWTVERIASLTPPHLGLTGSKAKRFVKDAVDLQQAPLAVKKAVTHGIDGVKVTEPAALAAVRRNPLQAEEILTKEAREAKSKGKTVLKRPKGAGKATKAKASEREQTEKCLRLADSMADVALDKALNRDEVILCAQKYNRARAR